MKSLAFFPFTHAVLARHQCMVSTIEKKENEYFGMFKVHEYDNVERCERGV